MVHAATFQVAARLAGGGLPFNRGPGDGREGAGLGALQFVSRARAFPREPLHDAVNQEVLHQEIIGMPPMSTVTSKDPYRAERSYDMPREKRPSKRRETVSSKAKSALLSEMYLRLDMTPLRDTLKEIACTQRSIAVALDEVSQRHQCTLVSMVDKLELIMQRLERLDTFSAADQQSLQHIESQQQRFGERAVRQAYLKPFARRLLGLWGSIEQFVADTFAVAALTDELTGILLDFGIELITPQQGEAFEARTMRPKQAGQHNGGPFAVVTRLCLPGARQSEFVLEHALVHTGRGGDPQHDINEEMPEQKLPQEAPKVGSA